MPAQDLSLPAYKGHEEYFAVRVLGQLVSICASLVLGPAYFSGVAKGFQCLRILKPDRELKGLQQVNF